MVRYLYHFRLPPRFNLSNIFSSSHLLFCVSLILYFFYSYSSTSQGPQSNRRLRAPRRRSHHQAYVRHHLQIRLDLHDAYVRAAVQTTLAFHRPSEALVWQMPWQIGPG